MGRDGWRMAGGECRVRAARTSRRGVLLRNCSLYFSDTSTIYDTRTTHEVWGVKDFDRYAQCRGT